MELDDLIREVYDYDPLTGKLTWKIKHNPHHEVGKEVGTHCTKGYRVTKLKGRQLKVHRICWFLHYGEWPKRSIDHDNRVRDDNRIENLIDAGPRRNGQNVAGFNFGSRLNKQNKWTSSINYQGKRKYLGQFDTEIEAQDAYRNFIRENEPENALE